MVVAGLILPEEPSRVPCVNKCGDGEILYCHCIWAHLTQQQVKLNRIYVIFRLDLARSQKKEKK